MKRAILALLFSAVAVAVAAALSFRWGLIFGLQRFITVVPAAVLLPLTLGLLVLAILCHLKWNAWWHSVSVGILCYFLLIILVGANASHDACGGTWWEDKVWLNSRDTPQIIWIGAAVGGLTWWFGIRDNPDFIDSYRIARPIWDYLASVMLFLSGIVSVVIFFAINTKCIPGEIVIDAPTNQLGGMVSVTINPSTRAMGWPATDGPTERIHALKPSYLPILPGCSVRVVYRKFIWSRNASYFISDYELFPITPFSSQEWKAEMPSRCN